jgi:CheY-like chemotaxis protein
MNKQTQKLILIVDDQDDDREALRRTLDKVGVDNPVLGLCDGAEAIRYLKGEAPYEDRAEHPLPAAMFLDLHMPGVDGWQVLDWLKHSKLDGEMWTFVYSDPRNVSEVRDLYIRGADSFLRKPVRDIDLAALVYHFPKPWKIGDASLLKGSVA